MPSRDKFNPADDEVREHQLSCFQLQIEVEKLRGKAVMLRDRIKLPPNAEDIWNGNAQPNVAIEVYGILAALVSDHFTEAIQMLQRAATATPHSVSLAWNQIQVYKS